MGTVPPMKKALFRLSAALALAAFLPVSASPVAPAPAPAWKLRDVDGNVVSSDQFKGKVVVLDFWATWCPPCRTEIPGYVQLQKKYAADGLVIVGVSVDTDGPQVVKKFMKDFGINYPIVMADDEIQNTFAPIQGYPDDLHHRPRRPDPEQEARPGAHRRVREAAPRDPQAAAGLSGAGLAITP